MAAKRRKTSEKPKAADAKKAAAEESKPDVPPAESAAPAAEPIRDDSHVAYLASRHDPFPIIAVGASAGGLEALQELFGNMSPDTNAGFVVITHQHPGHTSMLASLLSKWTKIPVHDAQDNQLVEQNHIYIVPPGVMPSIRDRTLVLEPMGPSRGPHLPIDHFFRTLAADQREHAICIILSGTGADGTLGLRAVKAELGMAMVQRAAFGQI